MKTNNVFLNYVKSYVIQTPICRIINNMRLISDRSISSPPEKKEKVIIILPRKDDKRIIKSNFECYTGKPYIINISGFSTTPPISPDNPYYKFIEKIRSLCFSDTNIDINITMKWSDECFDNLYQYIGFAVDKRLTQLNDLDNAVNLLNKIMFTVSVNTNNTDNTSNTNNKNLWHKYKLQIKDILNTFNLNFIPISDIFIVLNLISVKYNEDETYNNKSYALCAGLNIVYLNKLEIMLLFILDWKIVNLLQ